jgi:ABC-type multidrug transport system fused ATPase/permease subunit
MRADIWRQYAAAFAGSYGQAVFGAILAVLTGLTLVPIPLLVGYAFDHVIPSGRTDLLAALGVAMLALQLVNGLGVLWTRFVILRVTKQASARLRERAIARLLATPKRQYTTRGHASMHDTVVHETERVDVMSNALLGDVAPAIALSLGICAVMLALNWMLFLGLLVVLPLNILAARKLGARVRARVAAFHESFKRFNQGVIFLVRSIDLTRIQTAEEIEGARFSDRIQDLRETSGAMAWSNTLYSVLQQGLVATGGVIVLIAGGAATVAGLMTIGNLLSFFAGIMILRGPMHSIMVGLPRIMEGIQSLASVMAFLEDEEREPYQGTKPISFTGAVSLENVSFSYGSAPVLSSVSLHLKPGEAVGLVGPNGSGKSTIVNLILGFYRPSHGTLLADGMPYDSLDLRQLRRAIGVVTQDAILVPGTIHDNLIYGIPDATPEEVCDACRIAGVEAFVSRLDLGYETPVGEDGNLLSGGQRQRVALARALIGKPRLLILDEPMNHLDEKDSVEFLRRFTGGVDRPAILLISHREDAVLLTTRMYRLDRGVITTVTERESSAFSRVVH